MDVVVAARSRRNLQARRPALRIGMKKSHSHFFSTRLRMWLELKRRSNGFTAVWL